MAFADELVKDGRGRALRLDFSSDRFSTISYRYSDVAGRLDNSNWYDPRVIQTGTLRRALGQERIATSGTIDVTLDNTDGLADWLSDRTAFGTVAKTRCRVYLALYDVASPSTFTSQLMGEFVMSSWPRRDNSTIQLSLADDVLGALSEGVLLPTMGDWEPVGSATTNPFFSGIGYPEGTIGPNVPIQAAFGEDWVLAMPHLIPGTPKSGTYLDNVIVPVCCTTETVGSTPNITHLRVQFYDRDGSPNGMLLEIPISSTFSVGFGAAAATHAIWVPEFSPQITRDGVVFRVMYLRIRTQHFSYYLNSQVPGFFVGGTGSATPGAAVQVGTLENSSAWFADFGEYPANLTSLGRAPSCYRMGAAGVSSWYVKGYPLSARTQTAAPQQHAVDVLKDIATHYTKRTLVVDVDTSVEVKSLTPTSRVAGVLQPWTTNGRDGLFGTRNPIKTVSARVAASRICQSSDIDIFIDWSGELAFAYSGGYTFEMATRLAETGGGAAQILDIVESELDVVAEWVPDEGERGSPYNQVTLEGGSAYPPESLYPPQTGPYHLTSPAIALADKIITKALQIGWRPQEQQRQSPEAYRYLETHIRPRLRIRCAMQALRFDLGSYVKLSWGRGLSGPYVATLFQVEAINYSPATDEVELEAQWRDDLATERGYLLDNETFLVRATGSGGRTATVTTTSATVTFSSGNLTTDGVVPGDMLVLKDASQGDEVFTRFRVLRIATVPTTTSVTVTDPSLDFGSGTPIALSAWTIVRGATTYHTVVSDPTNYPLGGDIYGKMTATNGTYSNAAAGNRLLNG